MTSKDNPVDQDLAEEDGLIEAVYRFNVNPKKNIGYLCEYKGLECNPKNIAHLMHTVPGLLGDQIGDYLARAGNEELLRAYFNELDLKKPFLDALRVSLNGSMFLPGESQMIERVVEQFSRCYMEQNPGIFPNEDAPIVISFALIMLNSDLHNPNVKSRMTGPQFVSNLRGALPTGIYTDDQLMQMYNNLHANPFHFQEKSNEFLALSAPKMRGELEKKSDKFFSFWSKHYFVLANSCLYYFKDNSVISKDKPLGMIQLVGVDIAEHNGTIILTGEAGSKLQYVKFKKNRPRKIDDTQRMYFRAPNAEMHTKWLRHIQHSRIIGGFTGAQLMPPSDLAMEPQEPAPKTLDLPKPAQLKPIGPSAKNIPTPKRSDSEYSSSTSKASSERIHIKKKNLLQDIMNEEKREQENQAKHEEEEKPEPAPAEQAPPVQLLVPPEEQKPDNTKNDQDAEETKPADVKGSSSSSSYTYSTSSKKEEKKPEPIPEEKPKQEQPEEQQIKIPHKDEVKTTKSPKKERKSHNKKNDESSESYSYSYYTYSFN
ncbi:Sec7 domain containing protein [Trichomonas vaginalis G3]|uniref:Sec7 domain containing protein n=1 Tax=Trichomonas vaginalis (strain ATCC PRA-98 / G3) TaxID=412133 RepID=A2FF56_TRIV3|nr:regulation of ARF protein signal transduction [Trichomonas vaginalis G3]EAX96469.1 Sec7 domain containing protein [Trichomonas vaginalis G3]KAI5503332.1 regulation of ARF protein signal transduction [Trichomonas vaginalis G3]|eukprot:XP_001309399.1 Sec7 domain containing protein [Trichomonas vaginalis G3]